MDKMGLQVDSHQCSILILIASELPRHHSMPFANHDMRPLKNMVLSI